MRTFGVAAAMLVVGLFPFAHVVQAAAATPDNCGTTKASTVAPSGPVTDGTWNDPSLIGDGGRRLG